MGDLVVSLPFAECETCRGYIIEGTLAHAARGLKSRCRCDDAPVERADLEPKQLPNGRWSVAA
jgi:hypothetical protein